MSRYPAEVDVQRTRDVIIEFERLVDRALCRGGGRSAIYIPGRCDVTKICDWRIWQSISQTSSDLLVLDTRDVVEKYVVDNVIESSHLDVNSTTIFLRERLFESTNYVLEVVKLNNIHLFNTPHKRQMTNSSGLVSSLKSQAATFFEIACCISVS